MTKTAGIKPFSKIDDNFLGELKQIVLLFDLIGIPSLNKIIELFNKVHSANCEHRYLINEIEYLQEQGYLFDSFYGGGAILRNNTDVQAVGKEFKQLEDIIKRGNDIELAMEAVARLSCLILNNGEKVLDFFSIPLIKRLKLSGVSVVEKTDVINLIVKKMPIPDNTTPWDNIFEFKSNPDNKGRFAVMRSWVNKAIRSGLSAPEINDELESLLYQYQKSLELHKIKHNRGILQTFVIGSAELIENVATLKFSNLAKGLFSAQQSKVEILIEELKAPGNELSYIYKARETFVK
jgi:hypothetical protein